MITKINQKLAALARIAAQGVARKLVGVEVGGGPVGYNEEPWPVVVGGRRVGAVSSCVCSPRLEKNIGYAMVPLALSGLDSRFAVAAPGGERAARVVDKPFVDPNKERPRA